MKVESTQKVIEYVLPTGEVVILKPGIPVTLPELAIQDLFLKAPTYLNILFETWQEHFHDNRSPILPGSYITFHHNGKLRGGPQDGGVGKVLKVVFHQGGWKFFTRKGLIVSESSVRGVHPVNEHGDPIGCWVVTKHGLDGTREEEPRVQLSELQPDQSEQVMRCYGLSPDIFEALATGHWIEEAWKSFWRQGQIVPITPIRTTDAVNVMVDDDIPYVCMQLSASDGRKILPHLIPCLDTIAIVTNHDGTQHRRAWIIGALAIHRSWNIAGWTITHRASGKRVLSRIATKDAALDTAMRLLSIPGSDWASNDTPVPAELLDAVLMVLQSAPRYQRKSRARLSSPDRTWSETRTSNPSHLKERDMNDNTTWTEVEETDAIVRWEKAGQVMDGYFHGGTPRGDKKNLLYSFTDLAGKHWKTWETFDLKDKLERVPVGHFVRLEYLGLSGKMKKFSVKHRPAISDQVAALKRAVGE
jgi:hypothetical protein